MPPEIGLNSTLHLKRLFMYLGPPLNYFLLWNSIPPSVKEIRMYALFIKAIYELHSISSQSAGYSE